MELSRDWPSSWARPHNDHVCVQEGRPLVRVRSGFQCAGIAAAQAGADTRGATVAVTTSTCTLAPIPLTDVQRLAVVQEIRVLAMTQRLTDRQAIDAYETQLSDKLLKGRREA